jgi:hypothetical protein
VGSMGFRRMSPLLAAVVANIGDRSTH